VCGISLQAASDLLTYRLLACAAVSVHNYHRITASSALMTSRRYIFYIMYMCVCVYVCVCFVVFVSNCHTTCCCLPVTLTFSHLLSNTVCLLQLKFVCLVSQLTRSKIKLILNLSEGFMRWQCPSVCLFVCRIKCVHKNAVS